MLLEWVGTGRRDADNSQANPSRLVNFYRENLDGKAVLRAVPGMEAFADLGGVFLRAMKEVGGVIYTANAGTLYSITSGGTVNELGDILSSEDTSISGNNGKVAVAAGGDLFVYDGTDINSPDTGAFSDVGSVAFIGQRTIITERNGRRVQWSDTADAETFDALNFATAEQRDDNIIRGVALGSQYWVFKEESIEQWGLTGADNFINYRPGSLIEVGLKAFGLYTDVQNGGFFVGSDGVVYLVSGNQLQPVSNRAVETDIVDKTPDRCFYYEAKGHKFAAIRFSDGPAWVYDIAMNEWHQRAEGVQLGSWSAVDATKAFGSYYVGTRDGKVRCLTDAVEDAGQPLVRLGISNNLNNGGEYFSLDSVEMRGTIGQFSSTALVDYALGIGDGTVLEGVPGYAMLADIATSPVAEPKMTLRLSKDRGETYGISREKSFGGLGDYDRVVKQRAMGVMRNACVEVRVSDPVDIALDAQAEVRIS